MKNLTSLLLACTFCFVGIGLTGCGGGDAENTVIEQTADTGDAGGFVLPVSGEGIGTSIKSGLLAAGSIIKAVKSGAQPDSIYLNEVEVIISEFNEILPWFKRIVAETKSGGHSLPQVLAEAYSDTLRMF